MAFLSLVHWLQLGREKIRVCIELIIAKLVSCNKEAAPFFLF
ncbi:hypothetical protein HJ01_00906 [Flavobacterium frigoris PS1]|uniref:Uncharacterized protein n=1 Tax=Flavobacterium frigoris (strain PS1) TaxID=1086011 RepID=H7FP08_FLAFP|nr:hypothetical protein HJ01_00906 [Flavobacterium frigoris PS1]